MFCCRKEWFLTRLLLVSGAGLLALPASADEPKAAQPLDRRRIEQRVQEIQPTAKERRFDAIGWASGILSAERLARENGRPVFLFSNVGQLDIGRC
jgi:hypothetical protein